MIAAAKALWCDHHERLTTPPPGPLGDVLSRGAPHVIRLAMLYALTDRSAVISDDHLRAALALWDASARCAAYVFGDSLGSPDAEKVLSALRAAPGGLTRSEIRSQVFHRNLSSDRIKAALALLLRHHLVREEVDRNTGGAPSCRYYAINAKNAFTPDGPDNAPTAGGYAKNAINAKSPPTEPGPETRGPTYGVNGVNGVHPHAEPSAADAGREVFEL
jgi:hypothetical protein